MVLRFSRLLLVNMPIKKGRHVLPDFPPVGLGYLSESLLNADIEHDVLDMMLGYDLSHLINIIRKGRYDLVGFSLYTFQYATAYRLIAAVKREFPEIKIIAGGPHVSTFREEVLRDCPALDFGVVMEGEGALIKLCQNDLPYENIPGLVFREDGIIKVNDYKYNPDLDSIPYPRFSKFELNKYSANIAIFTSRGCPYHCIYCPVGRTIGRVYRVRSPASVLEEIIYWYNKGYSRIIVLDDNFTLIAKRVLEICEGLKNLQLKELVLSCSNGIRADKVDYHVLKVMKQAGFNEIAFGVESGTDKVLKAIQKGESLKTIEKRISQACELGFKVVLFFIIGSPTETFSDFLSSILLALRYPVYSARFYNLIPYPHSKLFAWVKENDYFLLKPSEYFNDASGWVNHPLFETPEFSYKERKQAFSLAAKIEKVIKRRYILRHYQGPKMFGYIFARLSTNNLVILIYERIRVLRFIGLRIRRWV